MVLPASISGVGRRSGPPSSETDHQAGPMHLLRPSGWPLFPAPRLHAGFPPAAGPGGDTGPAHCIAELPPFAGTVRESGKAGRLLGFTFPGCSRLATFDPNHNER
jgi:hypothetical protein